MSAANISGTNQNYIFFPVVQDTRNEAQDSTLDDIKLRNQQLAKQQQDNQFNNQQNLKNLMSSVDKLGSLVTHFDTNASLSQEERINQLMQSLNQLQGHLENLQKSSSIQQSLLDKVTAWSHNTLSAVAGEEDSESKLKFFTKQVALIHEGNELVHELNKQAAVKLPLPKTSARSTLEQESETENNLPENDHTKASDTPHTYNEADINTYLVMLSLVTVTNAVVMIAVGIESEMNGIMQEMMSQLQDYLALVTLVNKAFKDMQAQAALENSNNNNLNPGWTDKTSDGKYDMYNLLTGKDDNGNPIPLGTQPSGDGDKNLPQIPAWAGELKRVPNKVGGVISLNFYTLPKGADPSTVNPLLSQFYPTPPADGKYFLTQDQMQTLLTNIGDSMDKFIGGNLSTQNSKAFTGSTMLEGLTNGIGSSITSLQSQSTASTSKLGIDNQGLISAISNFTTMVSNLLSVMMKLFAIG